MNQSGKQKEEMDKILDIKTYINKDNFRCLIKLRLLEQGYNNGRTISLLKQEQAQIQFVENQQEMEPSIQIFEDSDEKLRLRRVKPIYRLFYSKDHKVQDLCRRLKLNCDKLSITFKIPESAQKEGIKEYSQRLQHEVLGEIFTIFQATKGLSYLEDIYLQFEKRVREYLKSIVSNDRKLEVKDSYGKPLYLRNFIQIKLSEGSEAYYNMGTIFEEIQGQMNRIMMSTLGEEKDNTIPIYEYGFFDPDYNNYLDPLQQNKMLIILNRDIITFKNQFYNPDLIDPKQLNSQNGQFEEQKKAIQILDSRDEKNYIQDFHQKFGEVMIKASPEFWTLLFFDILKDLSDPKLNSQMLETKFYEILQHAEAVKYLLMFRKPIVGYLCQTKFWQQAPSRQNKPKVEGSTTNYQVLNAIGISEEQILQESRLGLKQQMLSEGRGKQNRQKQVQNRDEALVVFNPEEYVKMEQAKLQKYFPNSFREEQKEYVKIRIDPHQRRAIDENKLRKISDLPQWIRKAFDGTDQLNIIQSEIYEKAFLSEENILICAPTGAGKTNVALLTILKEIEKRVNQETLTLEDQNFKIVYISPMKALASEIVDKFSKKLHYLGVKVKEFTGDIQLTKKELAETHIILTTPEKWDVITRKSNSISDQLQLLIIDEIHLLNDERGPILECVVARTIQQVERAQRLIRLVGLSATLPNYWDVAIFLQARKEGVFFFDSTYRPVPLCQKYVGIKQPIQRSGGTHRRQKKDIYNECTLDILQEVLRHHKQVLIFVHSRKETVNYAQYILEKSKSQNVTHIFGSKSHDKQMSKVQDKELDKLLPFGLAFHHAGMLRTDRNLVERLYLSGEIKVLVATATLAWGVNLPAYAVIIKGTDVFDAQRAESQNLSVLDVQQMFGRAGRPQFDVQGEATLMTDYANMGHYMGMLNSASYIESRLLGFLREALNAEIVLGNITNYKEAYDWLNRTFFAIRLRRNPQHYGVEKEFGTELDCDILVEKQIEKAIKELDDLKLVRYDQKNQLVVSTDLGRIASHYYIRCDTMKTLCDLLGITFDTNQNQKYQYKSQYQLLHIMAKAKEFEVVKVRPEEQKEIKDVLLYYWVFDESPKLSLEKTGLMDQNIDEEPIIQSEEKVLALISGYISQVKYENYSLLIDTHLIIQNSIRLLRCMLEMAIKKNQADIALKLLTLCKLIENRMADNCTPLQQFSRDIFTGYNSRKMHKESKEGFLDQHWIEIVNNKQLQLDEFLRMDTKELSYILNCSSQATKTFQRFIHYLPKLEATFTIKPIAQTILKVQLNITPDWYFSSKWHMRSEPFRVFVHDNEEILHHEEFLITQKQIDERLEIEITFFIPFNNKKNSHYQLILTSDRWIMREEFYQELYLSEIVLQEEQVDFTDLLDLQPLPTTILGKQEYQKLFSFKYFNPIQTQVFHSLFHTDDNVLIGAPTGSGKTIMAEFAIFRQFLRTPEKKVIYIAPMKAIAKERLKDWVKRLQSNPEINKKVLELTGDYTPDLEALMTADILITTPEKWDGISRNWQSRNYVSQAGLLIFDEIHLLGQDRGPVLEVIVSRMNLISQKKGVKCRMIGLSTAMANGTDVSEWFGVKSYRFYNFKPSCRPVPVTIHFNGFPERAYCPRMATMNKPAYQDIKRHSDNKPVIIFVSSRRQTRLTAMDLIALQVHENTDGRPPFLRCAQFEIEQYQKKAQDEYLKQTLGFGIGMHHAGLTSDDRSIVEELFVSNKIQILVATSTLAWGVNFPARLVIIKGTEYFDPKLSKYVDFPVTDLLQMIGRAGRPQFDTQATACVYVEQSKKDFYRKYLNNPFPIESQLLSQLNDHINAEIAAGTITNKQQCLDWMTWTYFFRRLMKNPQFYGIENQTPKVIQKYLKDLVDKVINRLKDYQCLTVNDEDQTFEPTFLGYQCSFYYIKHETILHFWKELKDNLLIEQLIRILSYAKEFEEVPLRHNEDNMNEALSKICPLKSDSKKMDDANEKTFLLFQAHLFRLPVPIRDFVTDTKLVIDQSIRMLHAMIDLSAEKKQLNNTLNIILLMQMIIQGIWFTETIFVNSNDDIFLKLFYSTSFQFFNYKNTRKKRYSLSLRIDSLFQGKQQIIVFFQKEKQELKKLVDKECRDDDAIEVWKDVEDALNNVPFIELKAEIYHFDGDTMSKQEDAPLKQGSEAVISVNVFRINHQFSSRVIIQKLSKVKDASWWLIVGNMKENKVLALKKIYFKKSTNKNLQIQLPDNFRENSKLKLYLLSDSYLGLDQEMDIDLMK